MKLYFNTYLRLIYLLVFETQWEACFLVAHWRRQWRTYEQQRVEEEMLIFSFNAKTSICGKTTWNQTLLYFVLIRDPSSAYSSLLRQKCCSHYTCLFKAGNYCGESDPHTGTLGCSQSAALVALVEVEEVVELVEVVVVVELVEVVDRGGGVHLDDP